MTELDTSVGSEAYTVSVHYCLLRLSSASWFMTKTPVAEAEKKTVTLVRSQS